MFVLKAGILAAVAGVLFIGVAVRDFHGRIGGAAPNWADPLEERDKRQTAQSVPL
jgi:hypothetical protein